MLTMAYGWLIVFYSFTLSSNATSPATSKLGTYDTLQECRVVARSMQLVYPDLGLELWRCVRIGETR